MVRPGLTSIKAAIGSIGGPSDNGLAETVNGLYKAQVIQGRGPRKSCEAVVYATLEWVDRGTNHRRHNIPSAEADQGYHDAALMITRSSPPEQFMEQQFRTGHTLRRHQLYGKAPWHLNHTAWNQNVRTLATGPVLGFDRRYGGDRPTARSA